MRVIVVGRGVFGLSAALSVSAKGHDVLVVGLRDPGASSEDISRIIRNDYAGDAHHTAWAEEAIDGWQRWNGQTDRTLFSQTGFANLTLEPMRPGTFAGASFASLPDARRLDAVAITDRFAFLTPGRFVDGYVNDRAGWADAAEALRFMERRCEEAGVGIVAERVAHVGDGWLGLADDGLLRADRIVVATGAWTPDLLGETADVLIPSGQPVLYLRPTDPTAFADTPVWALDIENTGFYGLPLSPDGLVKIGHHGPGVTRRLAVRHVPGPVIDRFDAFLRQVVPPLAKARLEKSRVCFYCDAPNGRFLIDRVPGRERVVVAAGGSGHGFKFAPVIGELIAAVVTDEDHPRRRATAWRGPAHTGDAARSPGLGDPSS